MKSAIVRWGAAAAVASVAAVVANVASVASPSRVAVATLSAAPSSSAPLRYVVAPTGNEARYRVREQLVNVDLPNDAIGKTSGVTGGITIENGRIVPAESQFTIDMKALKSDRDFRDRYVQRRLLVTDSFPSVTFTPTDIRNAPSSPRQNQAYAMDVTGNMVVKGVSHPTTWHVTATATAAGVTGNAWTAFTFEQFGLTKPSVPVLLSVADTIRLEYDFNLVPKN